MQKVVLRAMEIVLVKNGVWKQTGKNKEATAVNRHFKSPRPECDTCTVRCAYVV